MAFTLSQMRSGVTLSRGVIGSALLVKRIPVAVLKSRIEGRRAVGGCCNNTGETCKHLINIWKDLQQTQYTSYSCGGLLGRGETLTCPVFFEMLYETLFINYLRN